MEEKQSKCVHQIAWHFPLVVAIVKTSTVIVISVSRRQDVIFAISRRKAAKKQPTPPNVDYFPPILRAARHEIRVTHEFTISRKQRWSIKFDSRSSSSSSRPYYYDDHAVKWYLLREHTQMVRGAKQSIECTPWSGPAREWNGDRTRRLDDDDAGWKWSVLRK